MIKHTSKELATLSDKDLLVLVKQMMQSDEAGIVSSEYVYLNEWLDNFYGENDYHIKRPNTAIVVPMEIYKEAAKRWLNKHKQLNIKDIIGKEAAVHCNTEEKAIFFLKECEKLGILWNNGDNISMYPNCWDVFRDKTCYLIDDGTLTYGSTNNLGNICLIYKFEDFFEDV